MEDELVEVRAYYLMEPRGCGLEARRVKKLRQYLIGDHFALSLLQVVSLSGPWLERGCFLMREVSRKFGTFRGWCQWQRIVPSS